MLEQIFKNSLTGLPMGGGKGGSDFDPKGRSDAEVERFCYAFMSELWRHIGQDTDVPAGDIGVGGREIGYLFGMYKKLQNEFAGGVLTGKGLPYGGSLIRPEATGYGLVYFARCSLPRAAPSKAPRFRSLGVATSLSSHVRRSWTLVDDRSRCRIPVVGFTIQQASIAPNSVLIMNLKNVERGRIKAYADAHDGVTFTPSSNDSVGVWGAPVDVALPCATQNELDGGAAAALVKNGVIAVGEGANMPCTPEAVEQFQGAGVLFAPGKASNAGGVATSGLRDESELAPHAMDEEVDGRLESIMVNIHETAHATAQEFGRTGDYVFGANVAGFRKVADAMLALGTMG